MASATGGRIWDAESAADLRPTFLAVLQHIRSRYVLSYVPTSMASGWHDLDVRVRGKKAQTLARPGYYR